MKFRNDVITRNKISNILGRLALATTQASQTHLWENNSPWPAKTPQLVLNSSRIDQEVNGKARHRSKLASKEKSRSRRSARTKFSELAGLAVSFRRSGRAHGHCDSWVEVVN